MKSLLGATLISLVSLSGNMLLNNGPEPASTMDKTTSFGGACLDCLGPTLDDACETGFKPACEIKTGFCLKATFTSLTVDYCVPVPSGTGYRGCNTYAPKTCVEISTCTGCGLNNLCTNCGPASTEEKPTECSTIPYDVCPLGA